MNANPEKRLLIMGKLHGSGEPAQVVRTVVIADINPRHARVTLFDQHAGNMGTLVCLGDDLCDLVHLLKPVYLRKAENLILPEFWVDPPGVIWRD